VINCSERQYPIEGNGQALVKVSKEFVEIAMCGNRLGNLQQSLIPLRQRLKGGSEMPIHRRSVWPVGL
jgi:hypothetical protein